MTQDSLSDRCYLCTDTHELHRSLHPDFQFKNKNRLPPFSLFDLNVKTRMKIAEEEMQRPSGRVAHLLVVRGKVQKNKIKMKEFWCPTPDDLLPVTPQCPPR